MSHAIIEWTVSCDPEYKIDQCVILRGYSLTLQSAVNADLRLFSDIAECCQIVDCVAERMTVRVKLLGLKHTKELIVCLSDSLLVGWFFVITTVTGTEHFKQP